MGCNRVGYGGGGGVGGGGDGGDGGGGGFFSRMQGFGGRFDESFRAIFFFFLTSALTSSTLLGQDQSTVATRAEMTVK